MPRFTFRFVFAMHCAVLVLTGSAFCAGALADDGTTPEDRWTYELNDLAATPRHDCEHCYFLQAFKLMWPIPSRYTILGDSLQNSECIAFVAPRDQLLGRTADQTTLKTLATWSGQIRYCPRSVLDIEAQKQSAALPPIITTDGAATIAVWNAAKSPFTLAYITVGDKGLWITDVNSRLWKVMWASAKGSALPGDTRFVSEGGR